MNTRLMATLVSLAWRGELSMLIEPLHYFYVKMFIHWTFWGKKSCIRETKHPSTYADSSTNAIGGRVDQGKISNKKKLFLCGDFRPLPNKNVQIRDHFFPLLFTKDSKSFKILNIRLREVGTKRPLNGTSKSEHTQTDISTYRNHRQTGRCFENIVSG